MTKLTIEQLQIVLARMKEAEAQFPKAKILYYIEENCIGIEYALPKTFFDIGKCLVNELN